MDEAEAHLVETGAKHDARGRRLESGDERERILAAYDRSGLTQRAFAQREGIRYNTFIWWLKQRRDRATAKRPAKPVQFAEYRLPGPGALTTPLEVCLPDGTTLRGGSCEDLVELIKALRG